MPHRCFVTGCRGNYDNGPRVRVYSFPRDEEMKKRWISAIPRENQKITNSSRVCELHFHESDIETEASAYDPKTGRKITAKLDRTRLKKSAVPKIFPGCPSYLSSDTHDRDDPEVKRIRMENEQLERAIQKSLKEKEKEDEKYLCSNFSEFLNCIKSIKVSSFWTTVHQECTFLFLHIDLEEIPRLKCSVLVTDKLDVKAFIGDMKLKKCLNENLPVTLTDVRYLGKILDFVESVSTGKIVMTKSETSNLLQELIENLEVGTPEIEDSKLFISEQIKLITSQKVHRRYSPESMVFFSLLHSISPAAYKFLQYSGYLAIPHQTTIKKLCASLHFSPYYEQFDENFLHYAKEKIDTFVQNERVVSLMLDEIHLNPFFDYKGGNVVGMSFNSTNAATSAHVFMIQSLLSSKKDVIHILPVKTISGELLHSVMRKVILGLETIGFKILCIVSDNNKINRKAVSFFANPPALKIAYENPFDPSRPMFFVIDPVHILKCVRNNWINQKNPDKCMFYPDFSNDGTIKTACFSTLKALFDKEQDNLITNNCKLTVKSLTPSNLERQNVKLVLQIFNEYVIAALKDLGEKHNFPFYKDTADYIEIIYQWWCVVNVKSPNKGRRLRNVYMEPITSMENDERVNFLSKFLNWLNEWENAGCTSGILTKDTHLALSHTTEALLKMSEYCFKSLDMKYFLCGKIQTDTLEERFSKYRYLSGCHYNVSVRQIFESETKLRLQNSISLCIPSRKYGNITIDKFQSPESWKELEQSVDNKFNITITDNDFIREKDLMPVLTYLAGYCIHIVCKHLKCEDCKSQLTVDKDFIGENEIYKLISDLDRGNLKYPQDDIIYVVFNCFLVVKKLISSDYEADFLKSQNQRLLLTSLTFNILRKQEITYCYDVCVSGHLIENVVKHVLWVGSNILLKNYCSKKNDHCATAKISQKRKLSTFNNNICNKVPV